MDSKKLVAIFAVIILLCGSVIAVVVVNNNNKGNDEKTWSTEIVVHMGDREYKGVYDDGYFNKPANEYNNDLAIASYCFQRGSVFKTRGDYANYDKPAREFAKLTGFKDFECNEEFNKKPTDNSLGIFVANKKIGDYTLFMVGYRIGDYEREWADNFMVGKTDANDPFGHHLGFKQSSERVLEFLNKYIENHNITGKIKIWTSGYSRLSAISNVVGGMLDTSLKENNPILKNVTYSKNDIFVYTFETPSTIQPKDGLDVHGKNYDNIWNISRSDDMVTMIIHWGFTCYGNVIKLPQMNFGEKKFDENWERMLSLYEKSGGNREIFLSEAYYMKDGTITADPNPLKPNIGGYLDILTGMICDKIGDRDKFVDGGYQKNLMDFAHIIMENGRDGLRAFGNTFVFNAMADPETAIMLIVALKNEDKEAFINDARPLIGDAMKGAELTGDADRLTEIIYNIAIFLKEIIDENDDQYKISMTFMMNANVILNAHSDFYAPYCWVMTYRSN